MSEFRRDPLKESWAITDDQRLRQPREFILERQKTELSICPFCPGQEGKTPAEVFALRPEGGMANGPGWQVRVVPNKFPVLRIEGDLERRTLGFYRTMRGIGAHEVIIENPDHQRSLAQFDLAETVAVLKAYRARLLDLRQDPRFRYLQVFKNHGIEAGSPMPHSHSQLMAVPITPPVVCSELNSCREHYQTTGQCLICDLLAQEIADGRRVVFNDGQFLLVAPYASCFPFELRLFPLQHSHDFAAQSDDELTDCATALQGMLRRIHNLLHDPPYSFILHTSPPPQPRENKPDYWKTLSQDYHWHIELVPQLNRIAGFEWGSGFYINPLPPEDAARFLRAADHDLEL